LIGKIRNLFIKKILEPEGKMKNNYLKHLSLFSVLFVFLLNIKPVQSFAQGKPTLPAGRYADWAPLSENAPELTKQLREKLYFETPLKSEVEVPAYPDAYIISISQGRKKVNTESKTLPLITMISLDNNSKVFSYYNEALKNKPGWHWNATLKMFTGADPMEALSRQAPYVMIQKANPDDYDLVNISPTIREYVKTKIIICYNPDEIMQESKTNSQKNKSDE
jgi:hypothetical protein